MENSLRKTFVNEFRLSEVVKKKKNPSKQNSVIDVFPNFTYKVVETGKRHLNWITLVTQIPPVCLSLVLHLSSTKTQQISV